MGFKSIIINLIRQKYKIEFCLLLDFMGKFTIYSIEKQSTIIN